MPARVAKPVAEGKDLEHGQTEGLGFAVTMAIYLGEANTLRNWFKSIG